MAAGHASGHVPVSELLALDRSMRRKDEDGRLHVANCRLSKATVNPYRGNEIPRWQALGLDATRVYQLYRAPDELAKAAATWNGIPLLSAHIPHSAANPIEDHVAGTIGTDVRFEAPYIVGTLTIWRKEDIDDVEAREKYELSSAYYYDADMSPGTSPDGLRYDGIMRNIRANHVALVEAGRAGPDVMVHDSAMEFPAMRTTLPSRHALQVRGALVGLLRPRLQAGVSLMALDAALADTHADTWARERPKVEARIKQVFGPKLATDATLDDLPAFLGVFDAEPDDDDDLEGEDEAMTEEEREAEKKARAEDRKRGMDAAARKSARDSRRGARDAKRRGARDKSLEEWVKEEEQEPEHRGSGDRKMTARDGRRGYMAGDKWHPARDAKRGARDAETEEEREERERREKEGQDKAMDAAINAAEQRVIARMRAVAQAREDVRPIIGQVAPTVDTAAEIYRMALDHLKVDTTGVPPEAFPALLRAFPKPSSAGSKRLAFDAAPSSGSLARKFPALANIRHA